MTLQDTNNSQLSGVDVLRSLIKAPKAVGQTAQLQPQVEQSTALSGVELLRSTIKPPEPPKEEFADLVYTEPEEPQVEKADFRPSVMWPAKPTTPSDADFEEYDMTKGAPILSDQFKKDFMGTLQRFWRAAKRPDEILAGTAEFVSALPGFAGGIASAIGTIPLEIGDRIIKDKSFDILDLYNASARSFEKVMGDWHEYVSGPIGQVIMGPRRAGEYLSKKLVESLGGKPTESDQGYDPGLVAEVAMAPFTAVHEPLHKLADHPALDDMPNVRGSIKFIADIGALLIGHRVYKGGKDKLIKDVDPLVERAKKIVDLVDQIKELESQGADTSIIRAAQKVAEIQRIQANLIADEIAANMEYGQVIKEDLSSKTKGIKKIRQPDKHVLDVQVDKAIQKLPDDVKPYEGKVKTVEKPERGEPVPDVSVPEVKEPVKKAEKVTKPKERKATEKKVPKKEPPSELDRQTGSPDILDRSTDNHPLRNADPKETQAKHEMYKNVKIEPGNPETFVGKLVNDVNRWLDGDESVEITKVRDALSEMATRIGEVRDLFDNPDHFLSFRATVDEAATWARKADRTKIKRSGELPSEQLNMGFDPAKIVQFVSKDLKKFNEKFRDDLQRRVDETIKKINNYDGWEFTVGDRIKSKKTGHVWEVTSRLWDNKGDKPLYMAKDLNEVGTQSAFNISAHNTFVKMEGPKNIQLNMMIPVDQVPKTVAQIFKDSKILMKDIIRNKEIFDKTGFWYNKYDRKWMYEIDDSKVRVKPLSQDSLANLQSGMSTKLSNVIDHPELFEAMPKLKETLVRVNEKGGNFYDGKLNLINVKDLDTLTRPLEGKKSLLHEISHAVRDAAGLKEVGSSLHLAIADRVDKVFSELIVRAKTPEIAAGLEKLWGDVENYIFTGADPATLPVYMSEAVGKVLNINPAKVFKPLKEFLGIKRVARDYKANVGEVESRLVQKRVNMTTEERRAKPPWDDMDEMMAKEGLNVKSEQKLYDIVGATIEGAKQLTELAKQLPEYTKAAKGMKRFKPKDAANMLREEFNRTFIDRAGNIRGDLLDKLGDEGYRIIQKMYVTAGANPWASNLMYQMNKEINAGLTGREKSIRDNLLLAMRIKDIANYKTPKQFHYPDGLRPEVSTAYIEMFGLLEKLSPEQIALIKQSANSYIEWMKKPLNDLLEKGLVTKDEYDKLASHDYRKLRKIEDIYDRQHSTKVGKRKRSVYDSGVQHLQRGHKTDILEPDSSIMALEVFNRTYGRIFNNEANKTLLELARRDPENTFAREKKKPGWSTIYVYEEGVRKPIYISPDMAKEWVMRDSNISYKAAAILRYASMSPVLRTFATGVNWAFATANLPRDVMHAWYAARIFQDGKWDTVYSSHMPIFAAQMAWDLGSTFSDALFRKGRYVDYVKEGGGMEFLVHQGRLVRKGKHIGGPFDAIENFLGYYGETTEIMTRLSIRDRVIRTRASEQGLTLEQARKNPKITEEATFAARDYMDFSQGGWATKAADNAIPYLSAATQATRGLFRSFKPGSGTALQNTYKLAQFAAAITASYIAIQKLSPETHDALKGNSATQDNLCIPLGDRFGFEDEHGQMRYIYLKAPLDPGQKFFKVFFEACTDKWMGNEVDVDRVTSTLKKLSPVDITALPPSMSALIGYASNKDFWRNEDIWRKTDKPADYQLPKMITGAPIGGSEEEHTADTPAFYRDIGKVTGLSPERTKYAIEEIITKDNMWTDLLIGGYDMTKDLPKSKRKQHLAEALTKIPVIKRFIGITNPGDRYRSTIDEVRNKYEFERFIQNEGLDSRAEGYLFDKNVTKGEILEYMKSFKDLDTFNRLKDRFVFQTKTKELPNFVFWRRLQGLAPEPRAKVFAKRWDEATPQQRSQMREELQIVINAGGIITDDFRNELTKIRLQGMKEVEVED